MLISANFIKNRSVLTIWSCSYLKNLLRTISLKFGQNWKFDGVVSVWNDWNPTCLYLFCCSKKQHLLPKCGLNIPRWVGFYPLKIDMTPLNFQFSPNFKVITLNKFLRYEYVQTVKILLFFMKFSKMSMWSTLRQHLLPEWCLNSAQKAENDILKQTPSSDQINMSWKNVEKCWKMLSKRNGA